MARRCVVVFPSFARPCLALAVAALLCAASTTAQQPPLPQPLPQPQPTTAPAMPMPSVPACLPAQATLSPCLAYFMGNSSAPPTECCAQIRAMFQSQAPCLCAAMASAPAQLGLGPLGAAIGQMLPSSCDLPADACGSSSGTTSGAAPADPTTTTPAAPGGTATAAAAAPESGATAGAVDPTAPGGGAGVKSVPGMLGSAAVAGSPCVSAAALLMSLLVVCLL